MNKMREETHFFGEHGEQPVSLRLSSDKERKGKKTETPLLSPPKL